MKKYWIMGFVAIFLWVAIATVFAQTQFSKSTKWEYGHYTVSISNEVPEILSTTRSWATPDGRYESQESAEDVYRQAGFDFGSRKVNQIHWFNFLGGKGWELVSADVEKINQPDGYIWLEYNYWFKRPKR
jgi:hypothetical protein